LKYSENFNAYQKLITDFMRNRTGNTRLGTAQAYEQFKQLAPGQTAALQPQLQQLTSTKYNDLIGKIKQTIVHFMRSRSQNLTLSEDAALADFAKLKSNESVTVQPQLNNYANEILFSELNRTGSASATDPFVGNKRGYDAIQALFPGKHWHGNLNLVFSTLQTLKDGNINLLAPGGNINVGLPVPGVSKNDNQLGIIANGKGAVNVFLDQDFNVNQSRVFALGGQGGRDDITVWSSFGDIDAGRGAKSAFAVSNPQYSFDENGNLVVFFAPPVAGSGIRTFNNGNVGLYAPGGIVNASEAGIGGNNVTISATAVLGSNNIQIGGISTGIPAASTVSLAAGLTGVSNLTANVTQISETLVNMNNDKYLSSKTKNQLGTINIELIGFGN